MRFSVVTRAILSGAGLAMAALAAPSSELHDRQLAELVPFISKAETMSLEEALEMANNSTSEGDFSVMEVEATARCSNPARRIEWRNMSAAQRNEFIRAAKCLWNAAPGPLSGGRAKTRHETIAWVHQQLQGSIHRAGIFLPYHRYYLHTYMRLLRSECGFTGPFPWWDETRDSGNFGASGLFTANYYGSLPATNNGQGTCINDGAFGNRKLHIGPGSGFSERCLSRGENKQDSAQVNQNFFNACMQQGSYASMRECIEFGPHGYGHNAIGPVMAEVSASPSDPIFFMHHAYIDRMWKKWQNASPSRYQTISGCASPPVNGQPCPQLTLDTVLTTKGLRPDVTVRQVLDTQNEYLCYVYDY